MQIAALFAFLVAFSAGVIGLMVIARYGGTSPTMRKVLGTTFTVFALLGLASAFCICTVGRRTSHSLFWPPHSLAHWHT
jgi:hypothetical protein